MAAIERARLRERRSIADAARRFFAAIDPWYDWGKVEVFGLKLLSNKSCGRFGDETTGKVRFVTLQWLGLHLHLEIGRTPKSVRS